MNGSDLFTQTVAAMKKQLLIALGVVGAVSCSPLTDLHADIRLAISIPSGPRFYFESRPDFIYLDDYGFSISWGGPYDVVYFGDAYFIFQDGYWYRAYDYRGPWGRVGDYDLPPVIRRHHWDDIRRRRDIEYRRHDRNFWEERFRRDREHWQGPDNRRRQDDRQRFDDRRGPDDRRSFDDRRDDDDRRRPDERRGPSAPQPPAFQGGPRGGQIPSEEVGHSGRPQPGTFQPAARPQQLPSAQPAPAGRTVIPNQQQAPQARPQEQRRRDDQERRDNRDSRQHQGDRDNRDDRYDRR